MFALSLSFKTGGDVQVVSLFIRITRVSHAQNHLFSDYNNNSELSMICWISVNEAHVSTVHTFGRRKVNHYL